jgi:hypothetical protein
LDNPTPAKSWQIRAVENNRLDPIGLVRVSIIYLIYGVFFSAGAAVAAAAADKGQDEQEKQPSGHRNYPVMQHALKKIQRLSFFFYFILILL